MVRESDQCFNVRVVQELGVVDHKDQRFGSGDQLTREEEGFAGREEMVVGRDGREVTFIDGRPLPKEEALAVARRSRDRDHLSVTYAPQSIDESHPRYGWDA